MINNFITKTTSGLYCSAGDFYIDPRKSVQIALVSHAHGDHAAPTNGIIYCTSPTESFIRHRNNGKSSPDFNNVKYGTSFFLKDVQIIYYPAGHILGSAQILMIYEDERYLYTGDFKLQEDESCEPFQFIECDHLITETTFASPEYVHPDPMNELSELINEGTNILIGAYALGKAQRLTKMITKNCVDVLVYIHPVLEPFHRIYSEHGISLGNWIKFNRVEFDKGKQSVFIVPPLHFKRYKRQHNLLKVFATGWQRSYYPCDRVLKISDHADWNGVIELISRSKAKKVYTVHGNGKYLKEFLKGKIDVKIID